MQLQQPKQNETTPSFNLLEFVNNRFEEQKINSMPLEFQYVPVQILSKQFTKLNSEHQFRIHYLGPRFINTATLHKKYSINQSNPYLYNNAISHYQNILKYNINHKKIVQSYFMTVIISQCKEKLKNNHFYKSAIYYRAFQGMNPTLTLKDEFVFSSNFESGNLDCVIKTKSNEFDLFLRIDSNTRGHTQWFNFSVKNGDKKQKIVLNICNLTKAKTLYQNGMKPFIYSQKKYLKQGKGWEMNGNNLGLQKKQLRYQFLYSKCSVPTLYCLALEYTFEHQDDQVFFAYCIPYTYSQLLKDIDQLPDKFTKKLSLGRSLSGLTIPLLHISNHQDNEKKKKIIVATGRVHPGETNSSHILNGFLRYICSQAKQAIEFRNRINLIVIPMCNPDGVVLGNSRCSAAGKDLNRQYVQPCPDLYPEVYLIKKFIRQLQTKQKVHLYLDFHGHSRKKNTFFYGPGYSVSQPEYYKARILPKMIEKICNPFRFHSCQFNITEEKKATARAAMFQQFKIPYTYTVQSSIGYYYDSEKMQTFQYKINSWNQMGQAIALGCSNYFISLQAYQQFIKQRRLQRQRQKEKRQKQKAYWRHSPSKNNFLEDEVYEQRGQNNSPLKIFYGKDNAVFLQFIEQIKMNAKNEMLSTKKKTDDYQSSDDHDEAENLQHSKLKEFNNLLIQNARKDDLISKLTSRNKIQSNKINYSFKSKKKIETTTQQNDDKLDQINIINLIQKPKTTECIRPKNKLYNRNFQNTFHIQKKNSTQNDLKFDETIRHISVGDSPKNIVKSETLKNQRILTGKRRHQINTSKGQRVQKANYFQQVVSEITFPQKQQEPQQLPKFSRTSIFRRQTKTGQKERRATNSFSTTFYKKQKRQPKNAYREPKSKIQTQFKFDQIIMNLNEQSRLLNESVKCKSDKQRSNGIFPSSFYGVKQHYSVKKKQFDLVIPIKNNTNDAYNEAPAFNVKKFV